MSSSVGTQGRIFVRGEVGRHVVYRQADEEAGEEVIALTFIYIYIYMYIYIYIYIYISTGKNR